ncbi:MAG: hypothetical protein ACTSQP_00565 [Promethearchaeota archaeon]
MDKIIICPHFEQVDINRINMVFTKASAIRGVDKNLFYFTHYPILLYDSEENESNISENQILKELLEERIGNFVIVIEGETGTGKSELCIYLSHELKSRGKKVLHINKNSDLISILTEDLPNFYFEHTGKQIESYNNLIRLKNLLSNQKHLLTHKIVVSILMEIKQTQNTDVKLEDPKVQNLIKLIEQKLIQLICNKDEQYPSEFNLISPEDFKVKERDFDFGIPGENLIEKSRNLNQLIWNTIRIEEKIPSIDKLIEIIDKDIEERWTIIFEDFSITSLDQEKLQAFMERDNSSDHVNFIIAGLSDKLKFLKTPTALDRLGERILFFKTSKRGESKTLFLNSDNCVDFIRPYIGFFKNNNGSVIYEKRDGKIEKINYDNSNCLHHNCNKCKNIQRDIFPFNENFLKKIFLGLKKEDQKPRKYVEKIGLILKDYLKYKIPPSNSTVLNDLANSCLIPQNIMDLNNEYLINFIKWYSIEDNDLIYIPVNYLNLFNIEFPLDNLYQQNNNHYIIPKKNNNSIEVNIKAETNNSNNYKRVIIENERYNSELEENLKYISNWRGNPYHSDWAQLNTYLKDILKQIFLTITNEYQIDNRLPIKINIGINEEIFTFNDSNFNEYILPFQISLNTMDFTQKEIKDLLKMALQKKYNKKIIDLKTLDYIPSPIIEGTIEWRNICYKYLLEKKFFKRPFDNLNIFHLAFLYCLLSYIILNPWRNISLSEDYSIFTIFEIKDFLLKQNKFEIPSYLEGYIKVRNDLKEKLSDFLEVTKFAKKIILNYIRIPNSKIIDIKKLFELLINTINFKKVIDSIKQQKVLNKYDNRIYFLGNNKNQSINLVEFYNTIKIFKNFIFIEDFIQKNLKQINADLDIIETNFTNIDLDRLQRYAEILDTYGNIDRNIIVLVKKLINKYEKIQELIEGANYVSELKEKIKQTRDRYESILFQINLAYRKLIYFEDFLNISKILDQLIENIIIDDIDISDLTDLGEFLE